MAGRVTQDVVEVGSLPTDAAARVTQDAVEVASLPRQSARGRVTQHVVEVVTLNPVIGSSVDADLALDFVTRRVGTASLAVDYEILAIPTVEAHGDLGIDYTIVTPGTAVGSSFTFSARVTKARKTQPRGADLTVSSPVQIRVIAGRNLDFGWIIEPPTADIGADLQIDAEVQSNAVVGADYQINASVENPTPRTNLDLSWVVEGATPYVDLTFDAALSTLAHGDLTEDAVVRDLRHGDLTFDYEVEQAPGLASQDLDLDAVVRAPVSQDLALDYTVTNSVSADLSLDYVLRSLASGDLEVDAVVRSLADGDLDVDYSVRTLADGDLDLDHMVQTLVSADLGVDSVTRSLAGSSLGLDYVVRATAGSDLSFEWLVAEEGTVGGEYRIDAGVRELVDRDLAVDSAVAARVGSDLSFDASTGVTARGDLAIDHALNGTVGADLEIDAVVGVLADPVLSGGYGAVFLERPRKRKPPQDAPRVAVGKDLYFSSMIWGTAAADLRISAPVAARAASSLGLGWRVEERVVSHYDLNRDVLLAEIDEDLPWLTGAP